MDFDELNKELMKLTGGAVTVNLNSDTSLTDEQIREKNKKYVEEVIAKVEKEGIIPSPEAIAELAISERRKLMINDIGTVNKDDKDYPRLLNDPRVVKNVLVEDNTYRPGLNFEKKYNPNDFFIKEQVLPDDIPLIQQRIAEEYDAPHQIMKGEDGVERKHYHTYYFNIEAWCLELFFEAVGWDAKIVEAVMNKANHSLRSDIAAVGFTTLAYWARGKR